MAPFGGFCPRCGAPTVPNALFCQSCGSPLGPAAPGGLPPGAMGATLPSAPPAPSPFYPPPPPMYAPLAPPYPATPSAMATDRERTVTGLLLLVIGFALSWIPYIDFVGDIIILIGIIYVFLGRRGFGPAHHRNVVVGGALFVITVIAAVGLTVWFAAALVGQVVSNVNSASVSTGAIQNDFATFFVGAAVIGVIGALVRVIVPYALADRPTVMLLWAGFALSVLISIFTLVYLYPQIANAISQATSGTSFNPGPLNTLQTTATLLGLLNVVPALLFAWAYYRAREEAMRRSAAPAR